LWTGDDGQSHFQSGAIELEAGVRGDFLSQKMEAVSIDFRKRIQAALSIGIRRQRGSL
jgi:hypothetical protein